MCNALSCQSLVVETGCHAELAWCLIQESVDVVSDHSRWSQPTLPSSVYMCCALGLYYFLEVFMLGSCTEIFVSKEEHQHLKKEEWMRRKWRKPGLILRRQRSASLPCLLLLVVQTTLLVLPFWVRFLAILLWILCSEVPVCCWFLGVRPKGKETEKGKLRRKENGKGSFGRNEINRKYPSQELNPGTLSKHGFCSTTELQDRQHHQPAFRLFCPLCLHSLTQASSDAHRLSHFAWGDQSRLPFCIAHSLKE